MLIHVVSKYAAAVSIARRTTVKVRLWRGQEDSIIKLAINELNRGGGGRRLLVRICHFH